MTNQENSVLPADFDGVFRFTNYTDYEFKAKWGGIEYTFPPQATIPMIIAGATPEQVQHIRKKFARELAIEQFYGTDKFKGMEAQGKPGSTPPLYTESDLAPFIQRCLEPLPIKQARAQQLPKADESTLRRDNKGRPVTKILDEGESLLGEGSGVIE